MGVKTRQAIRSVLNNLRDEVNALLQDGLLEEAEGTEIAGVSCTPGHGWLQGLLLVDFFFNKSHFIIGFFTHMKNSVHVMISVRLAGRTDGWPNVSMWQIFCDFFRYYKYDKCQTLYDGSTH